VSTYNYDEWLKEVADSLNIEPEDVEDWYPQLKPLLYDAGASPREAADAVRTGM
jgi:hypothetical protein